LADAVLAGWTRKIAVRRSLFKVTLGDARKKREELRKQLEADLDPSAERRAAILRKKLSAENSFEAVALEWYNKQLHTWVPHHAEDVKRRLESNIFPVLGKRPLDQIEATELLQAIRAIETRGSYDLAHRVLQVCGQVFRYGIATGRCTRNLSADLRGALTPHVKHHQAAVRTEELPDLLRAIAKYDEIGGKQTRLALQLMAQTFVRTKELIGAEWVEFDLLNALWIIPAERMKMKASTLSRFPVRDLLCCRNSRKYRAAAGTFSQAGTVINRPQQHASVFSLPPGLQRQDDRSRLPRRGFNHS
jgi:integrase